MKKAAFGAVGYMLLASCSPSVDLPAGEKAIAGFHEQLNAGNFNGIYAASGSLMKGAVSSAKMVQIFDAVHRKLGAFQKGSTEGWRDNVTTSGHVLAITYSAQYARGKAEENFTFSFKGETAILEGYFVNSDALILS